MLVQKSSQFLFLQPQHDKYIMNPPRGALQSVRTLYPKSLHDLDAFVFMSYEL